MSELLLDIGFVMIGATVLAYIARLLKQPMILAYVLAGFIIGPAVFGIINNSQTINTLSQLGIAFLLFIVGLELDFSKIKEMGKRAAILGISQVTVTIMLGLGILTLLGFGQLEALYIAIALSLSSTMVVIKLLSDKNNIDTIYGRLILGMLLVQDVVAIFVLAVLPNATGGAAMTLLIALGKGLLLFGGAWIASKTVLPALFNFSARSTELLFLAAISLMFTFAFFADFLGYSVAVGSFVAGVLLASSNYKLEVDSRIRTLRDFFAVIFFVSLGMRLVVTSIGSVVIEIVVLSTFVIVGKPLIIAMLGRFIGYKKRIALLSGMPMGQISEFSLILVALGVTLGIVSPTTSVILIAVSAITMTTTTYVTKYEDALYKFFARTSSGKAHHDIKKNHEVIILGYNRIGHSIVRRLKELGKSYLVVDFDPDVIRKLRANKIDAIYGDVGDIEFLRTLNLDKAGMVISTIPQMYENKVILKEAPHATTIVTTHRLNDALSLYELGATYVIVPHFIGGEHIASLLESFNHIPTALQHKFNHIKELHERRLATRA